MLAKKAETRNDLDARHLRGDPLCELKLLVVGRGGAGKTTLLRCLAGDPAFVNEPATHSINIRELNFQCPSGLVRARAWDFGGQEILHATHQFFLTERSLYLLVLEPRSGMAERDAEYWLRLIENLGGHSPVIVVGTKSRTHPVAIDELKLRRKFPFIVDFVRTEALSGGGIAELHAILIETIEKRMPDVWTSFPTRWFKIKDAIAGMTENFLSYRQYTELCSRLGEVDPALQADLANILHALGLILYFGNDPRFLDTQVLNPRWLTSAVYAVIHSQSVAENCGELTLADMPKLFYDLEKLDGISSVNYPRETHRFVLELMRTFQLCYRIEAETGELDRYFIPELLPEFEPSLPQRWEDSEVRIRYRHEFLVPGLVPRFIVRLHERLRTFIEGTPRWRFGVVLRHATSLALIRAEPENSQMEVFVLGGDPETRLVLVGMIRNELERLHQEIGIQPIEELKVSASEDHWVGVKALEALEKKYPNMRSQLLPVTSGDAVEISVSTQLDKLLPAEARAIGRDATTVPLPVRVFVSYAHDDERQLKRLDAMLDVLEQLHGLTSWVDKRLIAGEEWDAEIRRRLEEMDIFLFIASQTSLVRPYIKDPELRRARERRDNGEIEIVAVKLEPCAIDDDPFLGRLQRLAPKFASVAEAPLKSTAWEQVRKDLLPVIKRVRARKEKNAAH